MRATNRLGQRVLAGRRPHEVVYRAEDTRLGRKVALKFLPEEMQQDSTARKRFLREAKSAAALDHPYICHIHEVGEAEGKPFICMEYIQGETLSQKLTEGPLPLKNALQMARREENRMERWSLRPISSSPLQFFPVL